MPRRSGGRSLRSSQEGAVYAEALVCLPVFIALLLAVLGFQGLYRAKLQAKASARRAAWLQADSGDCATNSCPDCVSAERQLGAQALTRLDEVQSSGRSLSKFSGRVLGLLWGRSTHGLGEATFDTPRGLSGSESTVRGLSTLPCNTRAGSGPSPSSALREACDGGLSNTDLAMGACSP